MIRCYRDACIERLKEKEEVGMVVRMSRLQGSLNFSKWFQTSLDPSMATPLQGDVSLWRDDIKVKIAGYKVVKKIKDSWS